MSTVEAIDAPAAGQVPAAAGARGDVRWRLALLALTTLALALRTIALDGALWLDEIYAVVDMIRPPLGWLVTNYPGDTHHPLYSVLAHLAVAAAGESPWTVRLPAVLFGAATVPALFLLGRRIGPAAQAFAAALLLTVSYHHVWFSQNARGYTILAFMATLCGYALLRGIAEGRLRWFALYAVAIGLGAWTHLTLVFMALAHALVCAWLTFGPRRQRRIADWRLPAVAFVGGAVVTVALYLPMLGDVIWWYVHRPSNLLGVSTPSWAFAEGVRILAVGTGGKPMIVLAGVAVLAAGVISYWRQDPVIVWIFVLPAVATLAGALLARGTMYPRFFFYLAGFMILICVRGAMVTGAWLASRLGGRTRLWTNLPGYALIGLAVLVSIRSLGYNYRFPKQDFPGAIRFVESEARAGEEVRVAGVSFPYTEYYGLPWQGIASAAELEALLAAGTPMLVVYMQPRYIERDAPGLPAALERACTERRSFHGTVGDGDIHVCRIAGAGTHITVTP